MSQFNYENDVFSVAIDAISKVALVSMQMPGKANMVDQSFVTGLIGVLDWLENQSELSGVIITSKHKHFCVGADIDWLYAQEDPQATFVYIEVLNATFRRLETLKVPVVAALNGSALGGGYELALACHYRVAQLGVGGRVGLPEVNLGVIPGAGGTQRLPRLIGVQKALELISQGKTLSFEKSLKIKMVDEVVSADSDLIAHCQAWIFAHPNSCQPWDKKGFQLPGGERDSEATRNLLMAASAMTLQKTQNLMPQINAVVSSIADGVGRDFDRALEVETRHFVPLAISEHKKAMVRTFWYFRNAAAKGEGLPQQPHQIKKVAIIGAGMMGAGLVTVCIKAGFQVVAIDLSEKALAKAEEHVQAQLLTDRRLSPTQVQTLMQQATFSTDMAAIDGSDLLIEAIIEDDKAKHHLIKECQGRLANNAIFASNTSAIPISHLATAATRPGAFIGLHFFSPVEKMELVEIICGNETSDETVGRMVSFCLALRKLPIVVGDGYGFFTSRVFASYLNEALELLADGVPAAVIENAATMAGMVVPPLKVFDEVSLTLGLHALKGREQFVSGSTPERGIVLLKTLIEEHGRTGKANQHGFYDYTQKPRRLWPQLSELVKPTSYDVNEVKDRLLLIQVVETMRCIEDGIIKRYQDAEIGAIFGIGFCPSSGGPLSFADRYGLVALVERLNYLAKNVNSRFHPPELLCRLATQGRRFFDE